MRVGNLFFQTWDTLRHEDAHGLLEKAGLY